MSELTEYAVKHTDYVLTVYDETRLLVQQGHEDDTLLKFFDHFIMHDGPHMNLEDLIDKIRTEGAMYRIQGLYGETPTATQQDKLAF